MSNLPDIRPRSAIPHLAAVSILALSFAVLPASAQDALTPVFGPGAGCVLGVGTSSLECGANSSATGDYSTAIATFAAASGPQSIAIGSDGGFGDPAIGAQALEANAIAIGTDALALGSSSIALGDTADASGNGNIAIGGDGGDGDILGARAQGIRTIAIGQDAVVTAISSMAVGHDAMATGPLTTALGIGAQATGSSAVAVGVVSRATAPTATAVGTAARATAVNASAFGQDADATAESASAFGRNAQATAINTTAIGQAASATFDSSTAIGRGAATTRVNQVAVGTDTSTYTFSGVTSDASRAAQSGPTQLLTTDANGNIASDGGATLAGFASYQGEIDENREGVALALAVSAPDFVGDEKFGMKMNFGTFEGETALGFSAAGVIARGVLGNNSRIAMDAGIGVGMGEGSVGGNVGVQLTW